MKLKRRHDLGTDPRKEEIARSRGKDGPHGYIREFEYVDDHRSSKIVIEPMVGLNKCGVISPRFDVGVKDIEPWTADYNLLSEFMRRFRVVLHEEQYEQDLNVMGAASFFFSSTNGVVVVQLTSKGEVQTTTSNSVGDQYSTARIAPFSLNLNKYKTDRDAEKVTPKEEPSPPTGLVLYRRIVEVKANERKKALEEILYALVVQNFMDADVSLIPSIAPSSHLSGKVDTWPNEEEKHEELHSQETFWPARRLLPRIDVKALSLFCASKNVFRTMMKTNHEYLT
ncbi:hypothetical protein IFM89_003724 [Coptis chinensis]|uniref:Uncharacterized protein n=1 Tax=Coptis chinensis TaxID=261450 RepID=A0A835HVV2_9MAGN|nr:hypothetical protein IFM89_003724 [Coptis chinensis]